jgi:hypothetical protein
MADDQTVLEHFYFIHTVNVLIFNILNNKMHYVK